MFTKIDKCSFAINTEVDPAMRVPDHKICAEFLHSDARLRVMKIEEASGKIKVRVDIFQ